MGWDGERNAPRCAAYLPYKRAQGKTRIPTLKCFEICASGMIRYYTPVGQLLKKPYLKYSFFQKLVRKRPAAMYIIIFRYALSKAPTQKKNLIHSMLEVLKFPFESYHSRFPTQFNLKTKDPRAFFTMER